MMSFDIKSLASRVCDDVNSSDVGLLACFSENSDAFIEIEFFGHNNRDAIGDIVYLRLSFFARSHLVFVSGDDSSNTSLWRVV